MAQGKITFIHEDQNGRTRALYEFRCGKSTDECPRTRQVPVVRGGAIDMKPSGGPHLWGWGGNASEPTLHPSINCNGEGGCGRHFNVNQGAEKDA